MTRNFKFRLFLVLTTVSTFIACSLSEETEPLINDDALAPSRLTEYSSIVVVTDTVPAETFTDSDMPDTVKFQTLDLTTPWGYNKEENATRLYPLVVNGCWGEGHLFRENVRKKYPSFYLDFNDHSSQSDGVTLANLIDAAIMADYRIDTNRIYLTGFSAGGSGSFKIVRGMLTKGKLFAGIIRVAGQSETVLAEGAVGKTSIWYHIGLNDDSERINVAWTTYANLKKHPTYATAVESTQRDTITTGYPRKTKTLTKDGIEFVKLSEYKGMGHDADACYNDPALFDWLFGQSLENRLTTGLHHPFVD